MTDTDLPPTDLLAEQPLVGRQDLETFGVQVAGFLARFAGTPEAPRDWVETIDWARGQSTHRDRDWTGLCQMFSRVASGCPGGFGSAFAQWVGMPDAARHAGGRPQDAPVGSRVFTKGDNPAGHVMIVARPFSDGTHACISTDALRLGWPDRIATTDLIELWDHQYLGWGENLNGLWIDIKDPKPQQTAQYEAIAAARDRLGSAIADLQNARDTAKEQKDWKDRDRIQAAINHLRQQRTALADLYETLRRLPSKEIQ